jgi:DUF4097 and DUF4098 domain-containing protein YvlB
MPTFSTPTRIDLAITLQVGAIEVVASDRSDTVVTIAPTSPDKPADRRGAEQTSVELDGDRLTIRGPKARLSFIGPTESVDVRVELPTGSRLSAEIAVGAVRTSGRLGATRIKASTGGVDIDAAGDVWIRAGHGNAIVDVADGTAEIVADHGQIRIGAVTSDAVLKASHGSIQVGECGGDLEAKLAYGDLDIGTAGGSVTAKTAYGSVRLGAVTSGSIQVESGYGPVSVGVPPGVAAWLDLSSTDGRVRNDLDGEGSPRPTEQTVAVRARTRFGDITITRPR